MGLQSPEPLKVLFHPAALLTIGDTLAFTRTLFPASNAQATQQGTAAAGAKPAALPAAGTAAGEAVQAGGAYRRHGSKALKAASGSGNGPAGSGKLLLAEMPPIEEQLGISIPITSRVPQR